MAYISTEEVAEIRADLKKAFPYVKFAVRREHHSAVRVVVLKAPFNFDFTENSRRNRNGIKHFDVNQHTISAADEERHATQTDIEGTLLRMGDHEAYVFLRAVNAVITKKWYDNSDSQSDYFDTAFYYHISVGEWDKSFEQTERPKGLAILTEKEAIHA